MYVLQCMHAHTQQSPPSLMFVQLKSRFVKYSFHPGTCFLSVHVYMYMSQCLFAPKCVQVYVLASARVCVCVDVCQPSSVNIVLCSSNSSSSGSAVAAHSTVYFPSWRTTSYQISRHCLRARCPTTRSPEEPTFLQAVVQWGLCLVMMTDGKMDHSHPDWCQ